MHEMLFAAVLAGLYLGSRAFYGHARRYHYHLTSFGAGTIIAVIFLVIFPEINRAAAFLGNLPYVFLLAGFTVYHLAEKYIYIHVSDRTLRVRELQDVHLAGFIVDSVVIGLFLHVIFHTSALNVAVLIIPFTIHVIATSILLNHESDTAEVPLWLYGALSIIIPTSAFVASVLAFTEQELFMLLPLLTGCLLYFVVRDAMPQGRKGKPLFFAIGVFVVAIAMLLG